MTSPSGAPGGSDGSVVMFNPGPGPFGPQELRLDPRAWRRWRPVVEAKLANFDWFVDGLIELRDLAGHYDDDDGWGWLRSGPCLCGALGDRVHAVEVSARVLVAAKQLHPEALDAFEALGGKPEWAGPVRELVAVANASVTK